MISATALDETFVASIFYMAKVFLSSTYEDLREYREAAYKHLRRLGHDVIAMEEYVASDERPQALTLRDISTCDLFVGLVAWRYGFIPADNNPKRLSITEMEYDHAVSQKRPVLVFLLHDHAAWPKRWMDEDPRRVQTFRERLTRDRAVGFFSSVDDLGAELTASVANWDRERATQSYVASSERDRPAPSATIINVDDLPLAWWLVIDFKARHDLLQHLEPSAFVAAVEKWEDDNRAGRDLPWPARLERARKALEAKHTDHEPSALWLAWVRATRASISEPGRTNQAELAPGDNAAS